jgi:hypothetical protein
MAKLNITEYHETGTFSSPAPTPREPSIATQEVDFTSGVTQSAAFNRKTTFVRLVADTDCRIAIGADPTAGVTSTVLLAGQDYTPGVAPGHKISVIAKT